MVTPNQTKREINQESWLKLIEKWQASNLSQKKYCENENISYTAFMW